MSAHTSKVEIGDFELDVQYDYHPEEKPVYDLNSPVCGPGCSAYVEVFSVKLTGSDVELFDILDPLFIDQISDQIMEGYE